MVTNNQQQSSHVLPMRHLITIVVLIVVVIVAIIAQFIVQPNRKAVFRIIYTSDIKGQAAYVQGEYAGYEKIAVLLSESEANGITTFLADAGGCLGGGILAELDAGASIVGLMNAAGYDALVPGDLDFVYGADTLSSLRAQAGFPILAANIKKTDGSNAFETYQIVRTNNVRIAIIGVTLGLSDEQAVKESLVVEDPVETVAGIIDQLEGDIDAVIVLAYTGDEQVSQMLAAVDGVNLVIESGISESFYDVTESGAVIVSAGEYGKQVGCASLSITSGNVKISNEFYTSGTYDELTSDETVLAQLKIADETWSGISLSQAGILYSDQDDELDSDEAVEDSAALDGSYEASDESLEGADAALDGSEDEVSGEDTEEIDTRVYHTQETATGNITADAILEETKDYGAAVALIEDSSILGDLTKGTYSIAQVAELFDEHLYIVTCRMTGGELRSILENSFSGYPQADAFLQVAGISYTYHTATDIGSHLTDVEIDGLAIDDATTYTVAMTNTLAKELGYTKESGILAVYRTVISVLCDYISDNSPTQLTAGDDRIKISR